MFGYRKPDTFESVVDEVTVGLFSRYRQGLYKDSYEADFVPNPKRVKAIVKNVLNKPTDGWYFGGLEDFNANGWRRVEVKAAVEVLRRLGYEVRWTNIGRWRVDY